MEIRNECQFVTWKTPRCGLCSALMLQNSDHYQSIIQSCNEVPSAYRTKSVVAVKKVTLAVEKKVEERGMKKRLEQKKEHKEHKEHNNSAGSHRVHGIKIRQDRLLKREYIPEHESTLADMRETEEMANKLLQEIQTATAAAAEIKRTRQSF